MSSFRLTVTSMPMGSTIAPSWASNDKVDIDFSSCQHSRRISVLPMVTYSGKYCIRLQAVGYSGRIIQDYRNAQITTGPHTYNYYLRVETAASQSEIFRPWNARNLVPHIRTPYSGRLSEVARLAVSSSSGRDAELWSISRPRAHVVYERFRTAVVGRPVQPTGGAAVK